jgi:hypothetical protein
MRRAAILFVLLNSGLRAQLMSGMNYIFNLDNGARILYTTNSQENSGIKRDDFGRMYGTAAASGNVIRRSMTDGSNQTWLGFELHIDRLPGEPIRFRVSMTPLGGFGFFGQPAPAREINNGDRILLDVLEEPGTGRKLYDSFQVGIGVDMQLMPPSRYLPSVPAAGATIELQKPDFQRAMVSQGRSESTVKGATISLVIPGKGRFTFSTTAAPGFRMEAIGEQSHVAFVSGKEIFDIRCASPVMESPGSWYLWVRHDADESLGRSGVPELQLK